jgi:3',5'-cyclic AMP phosphodiesterase CpdA
MEIVFLDLTMRVGEYDPKLTSTCRVMHAGAFPPRTVQHRWLQRTLSRRRGQVLVVVGHWPIFMSRFVYHDADSSLRFDELTGYPGELLPMLTEAGADLYLCGHHHVYERSRHPRLMQIMTAGDAIAWPDLMERPNKYRVRVDRRMCYTRFCYDPTSARIHGESIAIDGETIDAWSQKVRTK